MSPRLVNSFMGPPDGLCVILHAIGTGGDVEGEGPVVLRASPAFRGVSPTTKAGVGLS